MTCTAATRMRAFGLTVIGRRPETKGKIRSHATWCWLLVWTTSSFRPIDRKTTGFALLENTATPRGKPSITVEAGHAGTVETEDVNALINGCLNVMRYLKCCRAPIHRASGLVRNGDLASEQTGMFYPLVRGTYVEQGMKIGYVTDYLGKQSLRGAHRRRGGFTSAQFHR